MPLDPYGGHAPPPGPYVNFNRGFRSTAGYHRPYGFTTRMLQGLLGRGEPPRELGAGTGIPDPRSPEGVGSLLSMLVGKPRFRVENQRNPHPVTGDIPYGMYGEREPAILPHQLMLYDEANRVERGLRAGEPRLAGSLTYTDAIPATEHTRFMPAYGGTAYVHDDYRQTRAMQILSDAFMRDVAKGQPFETHFANQRLAQLAVKLLERQGYTVRRGGGTVGATRFNPPGWYETRPSPTPLRRHTQDRPWDVISRERAAHQQEFEEFQEWYRQFRERNG